MTTVIFVNAAEEEATPSAGLSEEGQDQTRLFTKVLRHIDVTAIYILYMNKAMQTAAPLSELRQLHPVYTG
ncbi:histidine phosphatase family protein [Chitinophaga oryzae]|uniref:Histidine phosphatase family protein n=1 Tax=Chitinophaga oryzae TaxID=2725414 RepID=A0ABX6LBM4_9BACT|nr:histidine phosphatase family protein [Chitinophaga oryzae]QJB37509.1 histidine phosphatase family protein [Chitinophaga oryzae]